jgi:hypothetical protein
VIVLADLALLQRAAKTAQDPHPVAPEEDEQHDRGGQVGGDQKGQEELVVLVDIPAHELRQDHAMTEARDRERLGDALEQAEDHPLEVRDRVVHLPSFTRALGPSPS